MEQSSTDAANRVPRFHFLASPAVSANIPLFIEDSRGTRPPGRIHGHDTTWTTFSLENVESRQYMREVIQGVPLELRGASISPLLPK